MGSTGTPFGWGGNKRGGGIAGPRGDVERIRAGDDGEYHHSRNLIKKIAVGSSSLRESRRSRGDVKRRRRITTIRLPLFSRDFTFSPNAAAARCTIGSGGHAKASVQSHSPGPQYPIDEHRPRSMIARADKMVTSQMHRQRYMP